MSDTDTLHSVQSRVLDDNDEQNFNIQQTQHIPQSFLDNIRSQREDSLGTNAGDYMSVARVPVLVHEKWLREGFDMMKEPAYAIVARLKQESLDAFLTTQKKV
tara:strand:- start:1009 stop:1317 length:309 start_codon:yes stop_codon:yes gene_type:complete